MLLSELSFTLKSRKVRTGKILMSIYSLAVYRLVGQKPHDVSVVTKVRTVGFLVPGSFLRYLSHMILENNSRQLFFLSRSFYFAGSNRAKLCLVFAQRSHY